MRYLTNWLFIGVGALFWVLSSCAQYREYRYEYIDRDEISEMKNLYLLGSDIESSSSFDGSIRGVSKDNDIPFYSTLFIQESFLDNFITDFNDHNDIKIKLLDPEAIIDLKDSLLKYKIDLGLYQDSPLPREVSGKWIREVHSKIDDGDEIDGYAFIEFDTSVWKQDAIGFFKVYNREGKVVWREEINDFSSYIVYDANSPYLIKNKQMREKPVDRPYYQELKQVYRVLGSSLAEELSETL